MRGVLISRKPSLLFMLDLLWVLLPLDLCHAAGVFISRNFVSLSIKETSPSLLCVTFNCEEGPKRTAVGKSDETTLLTNQKLGNPDSISALEAHWHLCSINNFCRLLWNFEGILEVTADITEKHKNILGRIFVKFYNSAFSSAEDTVANHL